MSDLFNADEYADWQHEDDDGAQAQLATERHEAIVGAIWHAAMLGLPDDEIKTLCAETGVTLADIRNYRQPILRGAPSTLDLDLPF